MSKKKVFFLGLVMSLSVALQSTFAATSADALAPAPRKALSWSQLFTYFEEGIIPVYELDQNGNETEVLKGYWSIDLAPGAVTAGKKFLNVTEHVGEAAARQWVRSFKEMGKYISVDYYKKHVYEEVKHGYDITRDVGKHGVCELASDLRSAGSSFAANQSRINQDDFGAWGSTLWNWTKWLTESAFYICGRTVVTFSAPVLGAAWAITAPTYYMLKPAAGAGLRVVFAGVVAPATKEAFAVANVGIKEGWNAIHFTVTAVGAKVPAHDQWNLHFVQASELPH